MRTQQVASKKAEKLPSIKFLIDQEDKGYSSVDRELKIAEIIHKGIKISELSNQKPMIEQMIRHAVIPRNTWLSVAKSKSGTLSSANTERFIRVIRIRNAVADAFGSEHVADWLETPVAALGGVAPMSLLANEAGAKAIEIYLNRVKHGMNA